MRNADTLTTLRRQVLDLREVINAALDERPQEEWSLFEWGTADGISTGLGMVASGLSKFAADARQQQMLSGAVQAEPQPVQKPLLPISLHCHRCSHEWSPRRPVEQVKTCPHCNTPYWNSPRKQTVKGGAK